MLLSCVQLVSPLVSGQADCRLPTGATCNTTTSNVILKIIFHNECRSPPGGLVVPLEFY